MDFRLTKDNLMAALSRHAPAQALDQLPATAKEQCCEQATGVLCCGQQKGRGRE